MTPLGDPPINARSDGAVASGETLLRDWRLRAEAAEARAERMAAERDAAFRAGAKKMREAAALEAELEPVPVAEDAPAEILQHSPVAAAIGATKATIKNIAASIRSLRLPEPEKDWNPTHRHKKRGSTYVVIGTATMQTDSPISDNAPVVIYRGEDGQLWARPPAEFEDGRFENISAEKGGDPDNAGVSIQAAAREDKSPPPRPQMTEGAAGFPERIVATAILADDSNLFWSAPPARHADVIMDMLERGYSPPIGGKQGFMTNSHRFVDRYEARKIAEAAGQLLPNARNLPQLFSEDVWETPTPSNPTPPRWLPMSTAPRDGTRVLVALGTPVQAYVAEWYQPRRDWWLVAGLGGGVSDNDILGWMPLPEMPKEKVTGPKPNALLTSLAEHLERRAEGIQRHLTGLGEPGPYDDVREAAAEALSEVAEAIRVIIAVPNVT